MLRDPLDAIGQGDPIKGSFETQHDGRKDSQIVARRVLIGHYAFQLLAEKFQGDPLFGFIERNMRVTSGSRQMLRRRQ